MIPLNKEDVSAPYVRLTWYGHSMFAIEDDAGTCVVTDPYDANIGYGFPVLETSVVLVSHGHYDHANTQALRGAPEVIKSEGRGTSCGLTFEGLPSAHDTREGRERGPNVMFKWSMGGLSFAHLGDLGHRLDKGLLERLTDLDVLFIPVGGFYTVDGKEAAGIVSQLAPRLAVPMHFKTPDSSIPNIQGAGAFIELFTGVIETGRNSVYLDRASLPESTRIMLMDYVR